MSNTIDLVFLMHLQRHIFSEHRMVEVSDRADRLVQVRELPRANKQMPPTLHHQSIEAIRKKKFIMSGNIEYHMIIYTGKMPFA